MLRSGGRNGNNDSRYYNFAILMYLWHLFESLVALLLVKGRLWLRFGKLPFCGPLPHEYQRLGFVKYQGPKVHFNGFC